MKIVCILILTIYLSACANNRGSFVNVENKEKNTDSLCLNKPNLNQTVYSATEKRSLYLTVGRTLDTPHSLALMVVNDNNNFTFNIEVLCGIEHNEMNLLNTIALTEEQMLEIYRLYDNIEVSKFSDLNNDLVTYTGTDGSVWSLTVVENNKGIAQLTVRNPSSGTERDESKNLFKLGEYLWKLAKIESPLY